MNASSMCVKVVCLALFGAAAITLGLFTGPIVRADGHGAISASAGPVQKWLATYDFAGLDRANDQATALVVDRRGNVYVTGGSSPGGSSPGWWDYATVKYDAEGNQLWVARYDGPVGMDDRASAIAVDDRGNVYVTGYSYGIGTGRDYATIKYDESGNQLWVARYDGPDTDPDFGHDNAVGIGVDHIGNVYVTGYSYGDGTGLDFATVRYDKNGDQVWVARYDGVLHANDAASALALGKDGDIYVTGYSTEAHGEDLVTVSYDSRGRARWVARYNGPAAGEDGGTSLVVDAADNVYVAGYSEGVGTGYDYVAVKYGRSGKERWASRYDGPSSGDDGASSIALDNVGNVYLTGPSLGHSGLDYATVKYDRTGDPVWMARYEGDGNGLDVASGLAVDARGDVFVTGYSYGDGTRLDYATVKYAPGGTEVWVSRYDGPGSGDDYATSIAVARPGSVVVSGYAHSGVTATRWDYTTIWYQDTRRGGRDR